jgi:predicted permease
MMTGWIRRITRFVRRPRLDDELADEIQMHIELRAQALIGEGMDPRDAAAEARRRFGNVINTREESRDMWNFPRVETIVQDLGYAVRLLRRSPAFATVALVALGIGIGSAIAVFTLINAVLLRPLPVANAEELVILKWRSPAAARMPAPSLSGNYDRNDQEQSSTSFSLPTYEAMRREAPAGVRIFGFAGFMSASLAIDGTAEAVSAHAVSGNYFDTLGVTPAAGRLITDADDRVGAAPVAVISEQVWRSRFGASPAIIGRVVSLNAVPVTLVGVIPQTFTSTLQVGESAGVTVPLALRETIERVAEYRTADSWWVLMMARIAPGTSWDDARTQLEGPFRQSVAAGNSLLTPDDLPSLVVSDGARGQVERRQGMREPLRIMALIVTVVLLVACAILANLLLARGQARRREIAIRVAVGAGRARVVRQLFTEGLLLATLGSLFGVIVARSIAAALMPALVGTGDAALDLSPDWKVVMFAAALATVTAALFALLPAMRSTDVGVTPGLQGDERTMTAPRDRRAFARGLVAVQVALSMLLITAAALLVRTVINLQAVPAGFDPNNLLIFRLDPTRNGYSTEQATELYARAMDRLEALPGVRSATILSLALIGAGGSSTLAALPTDPPIERGTAAFRSYARTHETFVQSVGDTFFTTMGIPLLQGRALNSGDRDGSPGVVIVNHALARRLFNTTDVLGKQLKTRLDADAPVFDIVGLAADAKYTSLRRDAPPTMYFSYRQRPVPSPTLAIKTEGDPMRLASQVRTVIREIDPTLPVMGLRTQAMQIERALSSERFLARLAAVLGGLTLLLGCIGLFGVLAYDVGRRRGEIGLRMALGAESRSVRWMVMRQSLMLTAIGLVVGAAAARWATRVLETMLFGLSPTDPLTLAGVAALMLLSALAAAYFPARRAALVDPVIALRAE